MAHRVAYTPHDAVNAFLATLATQAEATGMVEMTAELVAALDTAAWKLEQQRTPATLKAWQEDQAYRYR